MNTNIRRTFQIFVLGVFLFQCKTVIQLQGEIHHPKTSDDWDLTLEHFLPALGTTSKKYPVILCHGWMSNRTYLKIKRKKFDCRKAPEGRLRRLVIGFKRKKRCRLSFLVFWRQKIYLRNG